MKIDKTNLVFYSILKREYGKIINWKNIVHVSRFKLWTIFKKETKNIKEVYLRNTLAEWIDNFEGSDDNLFSKLKKILRKTKIKLNDIERDRLLVLEERAFSEIRQIKTIEVDYRLSKGEFVGVKYINSHLYEKNKKIKKLFEGDLLISNQRIIFDGFDKSFRFKNFYGYSYNKHGLEFQMKNGEVYLIRIHDSKTLKNTFENIINRKVKVDIKKY